jgi:MerR family transcriptional regulator, light-induced transcriptional regulator
MDCASWSFSLASPTRGKPTEKPVAPRRLGITLIDDGVGEPLMSLNEGSASPFQDQPLPAFGREILPDRSPVVLAKLIEGEIIPRLLLAHLDDPTSFYGRNDPSALIEADEPSMFARWALDCEAHQLVRHVDDVLARGVEVETVLIELLAPAARTLGEQWEDDTIDFIAVTMGLWRLQEVVHELAARAPGAAQNRGGDRRALFCVMPGEQHSFGTTLVDECFRRRGWNTLCVPSTTEQQLLALARERWFEIIGLTVSCDHHIEELPRLIEALRKVSRNPHTGVMVGGPIFVSNADLARQVGADGTAKDARAAVDCAEVLVSEFAQRPAINV